MFQLCVHVTYWSRAGVFVFPQTTAGICKPWSSGCQSRPRPHDRRRWGRGPVGRTGGRLMCWCRIRRSLCYQTPETENGWKVHVTTFMHYSFAYQKNSWTFDQRQDQRPRLRATVPKSIRHVWNTASPNIPLTVGSWNSSSRGHTWVKHSAWYHLTPYSPPGFKP